jgi:hypothetical protein
MVAQERDDPKVGVSNDVGAGATEALRELVTLFNRRQRIEVERFFAPDFRLEQPGGVDRAGLSGAREMVDAWFAMGESAKLEILAMIEEGDLVAVRWHVSGAGCSGCGDDGDVSLRRRSHRRRLGDRRSGVVAKRS